MNALRTAESTPESVSTGPTDASVPTALLGLLDHALEQTTTVFASLDADDDHRSTPCAGWTVADIAEHVIGALEMFTEAAGGTMPSHDLDDSRSVRLERATTATRAAWSAPGRLDGTITLPFGTFPATLALLINIVETFVHTCDLAVATGRRAFVDDASCDEVRERAATAGFDAFRGPGMFEPAISTTASGLEGLLAYMGRDLDRVT